MVCRVNGLAYCLSRISTWQGASPYGVPLGRPVGLLTAAGNSSLPLAMYCHIRCPTLSTTQSAAIVAFLSSGKEYFITTRPLRSLLLFFFSPRLPLVAASHTHLPPFLPVKPPASHQLPYMAARPNRAGIDRGRSEINLGQARDCTAANEMFRGLC